MSWSTQGYATATNVHLRGGFSDSSEQIPMRMIEPSFEVIVLGFIISTIGIVGRDMSYRCIRVLRDQRNRTRKRDGFILIVCFDFLFVSLRRETRVESRRFSTPHQSEDVFHLMFPIVYKVEVNSGTVLFKWTFCT